MASRNRQVSGQKPAVLPGLRAAASPTNHPAVGALPATACNSSLSAPATARLAHRRAVRQIIVSAGEKLDQEAPRMTILWDKVEVPNVMSVRIAIWNGGSHFIDVKDISKSNPIQIVPSKGIRILSADVLKTNREELAFTLSVVKDKEAEIVQVHVNGAEALERLDGGLFQILYSGGENVEFLVTGRIKGAAEGFHRENWQTISELKSRPLWRKLRQGGRD